MTNAVFIIHSKEVKKQADFLCAGLNQVGIFAITYDQAVGKSTHSEIQENWLAIATITSAFIVLGGPRLFTDSFLTEMAKDAIAGKKAVCVEYGHCPEQPFWFSSRCISIEYGKSRGWNRLVQALNKHLITFVEPQFRPN